MKYIWQHLDSEDIDEPTDIYYELTDERTELRRLEMYPGGVSFACGGERGHEEALSREPLPEDAEGCRSISPIAFYEQWAAALERPDGFQGMFM